MGETGNRGIGEKGKEKKDKIKLKKRLTTRKMEI